jgi:hypothetical protein
MKIRPFRQKQAGKHILRERILADVSKSPAGIRVIKECQAALAVPVNADETSRKLIFGRYAAELDIFPYEMEELVARIDPEVGAARARRQAETMAREEGI